MRNPENSRSPANAETPLQRTLRFAKRLMIVLLIGYALLVLVMVLMETSMVYPVAKYPAGGNWSPNFPHEDVIFTSADGVECHGWLMRTAVQRETPRYVIYCHGNGENVAGAGNWSVREIVQRLDATAMVFDYRGYGKSEGSPFEAGVLQDAEAALDWLCEKTGLKPKDIIVVGSSIGGGPAVYLASEHGCKALVLRRTFSSLSGVAASKYPWLPIRMVMRNQYPSIERIKDYHGPLFQSHGEADSLIPIEMGQALFEAAPTSNKKFFPAPGMGHLDPLPQHYWSEMAEFVNAVE